MKIANSTRNGLKMTSKWFRSHTKAVIAVNYGHIE